MSAKRKRGLTHVEGHIVWQVRQFDKQGKPRQALSAVVEYMKKQDGLSEELKDYLDDPTEQVVPMAEMIFRMLFDQCVSVLRGARDKATAEPKDGRDEFGEARTERLRLAVSGLEEVEGVLMGGGDLERAVHKLRKCTSAFGRGYGSVDEVRDYFKTEVLAS
ncbi:hypothetical protein HK104_001919 [Borealophlyctis nickersoniae]|nr:hypothetical protein HK104_001919 [Borealophlyctis nickersoniae]